MPLFYFVSADKDPNFRFVLTKFILLAKIEKKKYLEGEGMGRGDGGEEMIRYSFKSAGNSAGHS